MRPDTPIWQLTVTELKELIRSEMPKPVEPKYERRIVHGIRGIQEIFGCSMATAQKIKNSGIIDKAITQVGRKITVDVDKALELKKR